MADDRNPDGNRLTVPIAIIGVMFSLTVICIGAVVKDKENIAGLKERVAGQREQVDALRDRVAHLEAGRSWPQDRRGP